MRSVLIAVLWMLACLWPAAAGKEPGRLVVTVTAPDGGEVRRTSITLTNKLFTRSVTVDGRLVLENVPVGTYRLLVTAPGYSVLDRENVAIAPGETTTLDLELSVQALSLRDVVVAPSSFSLLTQQTASTRALDRETVRNLPRFGNEILRALDTLPGTSSNDFGSAFNIRGGEYREVRVTLDGMEIFDPFHIKDYSGVFSFFDAEAIGGLELRTGGFDATTGNAMSGTMALTSTEPAERSSVATVSFGGIGYRTEGRFDNGLGSYLFSARRGYLDILLGFTGDDAEEGEIEDQDVTYWDTHGKLTHVLGASNNLSFNYLLAGDGFVNYEEEGTEREDVDSDYDDLYVWVNLDTVYSDRLSSRTSLFTGSIERDRSAASSGGEELEDYRIDDVRSHDWAGLSTDWEYSLPKALIRFGASYRDIQAEYDYSANIRNGIVIGGPSERIIEVKTEPEGEELGAYLTGRFALNESVIVETGLRYDRQTLFEDSQVSPRMNLTWSVGPDTTLRLAYGHYYQPERAHELQVADGVDHFSKPEKAVHTTLSLDQRLGSGLDFRAEAYVKDLSDLRTRYQNLTKSLVFYPGLSGDRVAIEAETGEIFGVELMLSSNRGRRLSWSANYAWQRAEDTLADGRVVPRPWEQEHTVNLSANYRLGRKWNLNASWLYHTGWRTTPFSLDAGGSEPEIVPGEWYSDTFPAYHRMDLRINRSVYARGKRAFELFIDVTNLYNRENVRGYEEILIVEGDTGPALRFTEETWLPILPSFGFNWRF